MRLSVKRPSSEGKGRRRQAIIDFVKAATDKSSSNSRKPANHARQLVPEMVPDGVGQAVIRKIASAIGSEKFLQIGPKPDAR